MKKKVLVTGLHGYVGSLLADSCIGVYDILDFSRSGKISGSDHYVIRGDLLSSEDIAHAFEHHKFDCVLHLAARTHIEECQRDEPKGKQGNVWKTNVDAVEKIVAQCARHHKHLVFMSSECVFDGKKGEYREDDERDPINWYGVTKKHAEDIIISSNISYTIIRSVLSYGHPRKFKNDIARNYFEAMREGRPIYAVEDQSISLTYIEDLVHAVIKILDTVPKGIYHFAGDKPLTPYQFALAMKKYFSFHSAEIHPVSLRDYFKVHAKLRLKNATLNSTKARSEWGVSTRSLEESFQHIQQRSGTY